MKIRLNKEKLKTWLLIILMIASLVQIGIHWNQQGQGFPFRFIAQIFNNADIYSSVNVDSVKLQYFVPEIIIVTRSPTASKWKINQGDNNFKKIWNDISQNYLPEIIDQKPSKTLSKEEWPILTGVRCIRIDFPVNWPSDIVLWLENKNSNNNPIAFKNIKSIAILPEEDVNKSINTIYIYDGIQVFKYAVNIKKDFLSKDFYTKLPDILSIENKPEYDNLSEMSSFNSSEDILIPIGTERAVTFSNIKVEIPTSIVVNEENINTESIQKAILLNQKDSFMTKFDENTGQFLFTDTENVYRFYDNGLFEYKYLPENNNPAGDISAAFSKALSLIELRRGLLGDIDLVLTHLESFDNYHEMHFNYYLNGFPVYYAGENKNERLSSPLIIRANAQRVTECKWVIRSFTKIGPLESYYPNFAELFNNQIPSTYPELMNIREVYFERIEPGYVFGINDGISALASPQWIISTKSMDYFIPLREEG